MELLECDPMTGRRRYRWALVGVPKKNGKTELMAAVGLFFLVADGEPAPFVIAAAASDEQADLVFGSASTMADPNLNAGLNFLVPKGQVIEYPASPRARLRRVAAAAGTNDGKNVFVVICDELHEWKGKGEQIWNILTNGSGARDEPLVLQITTAGDDLETVAGRQYEHGLEVRAGDREDDTFYFAWWEAPLNSYTGEWPPPPEDLIRITRSCNPSYGLVMGPEFYLDQVKKKTEAVFRRYFWNNWTEAEEIWEAAQFWDALTEKVPYQVGLEALDPGARTYCMVDIGIRHDSSAVAVSQRRHDGKVVTVTKVWTNPYRPGTSGAGTWRLELSEVEAYLLEVFRKFPVPSGEDETGMRVRGPVFYYDPYFFQRSAQDLRSDYKMNLVEYPQTDLRMVPASQTFFELIKTDRLVPDDSHAFRTHIRTVVAKETPRGWRISKPKGSRKRIDAAIAGAVATYECTVADDGAGGSFHIW